MRNSRMKLRKKRGMQYIREGAALIVIVTFILTMYVSILNISYRANNAQFVNGMNHMYKQEIKNFVDNKVEQLKQHNEYIDRIAKDLQALLNHYINLILEMESTVEQTYDDLIKLSQYYSDGIIMIGDQETDQLQAVLMNGTFITELNPMTLQELMEYLDCYETYELEQDSKWIVSGYSYREVREAAKSDLLNKVLPNSINNFKYSIISLDDLAGGNGCGQILFTTILELDEMVAKPLNCTVEKNAGDDSFQEVLDLVREEGSGFTVINWGEEQNPSLIYANYYPDYEWIIAISAKESSDLPAPLIEYEQFRDTTKFQMNIAIIVACFSFFMAIVGGWLVYKFVKLKEIECERKRNKIVEAHNLALMSKNQKINQIVHDIKNHLICIKGLIGMKQGNQAMTYIDSVFQDIHQLSDIVITGNQFMDIILNEKINQMKAAKIICYKEIEKINFDFMDKKDITIMFTNLFDNAIESCERSQQKVIHFNLFTFNDGFIVIKLRNSCDVKPISIKGKLQTTKVNSDHHGYGVANIIRTVERYKGETLWEYNEQRQEFNFVITIPIPSNQ